MKRMLLAIAAVTTMTSAIPGTAMAQQHGTRAQRADNADERADLRDRMDEMDQRIGAAQASRAITRTRASELRRKLVTTRQSYVRATRGQGFVSAAESATYNRTLDSIDAQLPQQ
ncbi:MAG: hypothetical protein EOO77_39465 [Oxalobacteraceae bacterium]|nr:MAG: hypothetical protein EOO77_39465 [Oxalobacteraceae bacterium]